MEGKMVNKVLIIIFILSAMVFSQTTSYIEILKSDVNTQRRALITAAMEFTEEEAQKFWPIYKEYEIEYDKIEKEQLALSEKYFKKFSKELEIRRTVKLQMILNRIELMINLQKASTIPVLE
jgi:hypothetical protein